MSPLETVSKIWERGKAPSFRRPNLLDKKDSIQVDIPRMSNVYEMLLSSAGRNMYLNGCRNCKLLIIMKINDQQHFKKSSPDERSSKLNFELGLLRA